MDQHIWRWDATAVATAIRTGKISSREATQAVLARLEAVNPKLNAVTVVLAEQALATADRADAARRRGEPLGLLHGVPVTIKENVDQEGQATANGVVAFKDVIATTENLLGLPATAVPVGHAGNIPLGVQVIASRYREDLTLDAAEIIEAQHGLPTPIEPVP